MTNDTWGQARETLQTTIGKNNYQTWIEPLTFISCDGGVAEFGVQTSFQGDWVSRNFGDEILRQFDKLGESVDRLKFSVQSNRPVKTAAPATTTISKSGQTAAPKPVQAATPSDDPVIGAPLDKRFTFDRFVVGKPNELAHAASRRVAEGGPVSFNPLFLYGGVGLGKTHLMHAIAWELQTRSPELKVVYLSAEQFMYRFIQALRDRQMMDFKSLFRSVDVLMVDDVQFIAGKDSTQDEFFHTFNALIDQQKQIIISADRAPGEIDGLEERIRSRLQWGLVVDLHPTDYELRLGILQQKVEQYRAQYQELKITDGVLEFLAHRISNNVRVLEGALTRLFALASLVGREITLEMAQESLADILRQSDRKVTMDEIMRKTCDYYNVRMSDLLSPKRSRNIARPRQMAMWLAKLLTQRSYPEIGKRFGNRDHTTVIHAVRKIDELKAQDSQVAEDAELLRRMLEA
ncbi:chromosomal replication initiator protein DnaA [Litoreibacter albidus]|uniref:Chromosomal replication initiator protein DnaA n=1 Tax=Litoreibacter albidus TaxID=670155 RepID=A0A1H2VK53_9RHOB|nr:chromosomal replication initiator protein DnaA [Litoreibacter albidus]SDW68693.1 chromosomal replication initiator protein DnaA [Litoreibacter albidus]